MNVLQDLLDGHFNASVDVHNSRVGIQPNSVIVDAWEAFCKAEDAIREYCEREHFKGYCKGKDSAFKEMA